MDFYISASTDVGTKKQVNQDSLMVRKLSTPTGKMVFAVLCDGMGGLKHGEIASSSVISAFSEWMYSCLPELSKCDIEDGEIRRQWCKVIDSQNEAIRTLGQDNDCKIGSTATVMLLTEKRYYILNIGDTRAYEISEGGIRQITKDHTVVENEVELGNMTVFQAENSPVRSALTKCIGVAVEAEPDMFFGDTKRNTVYMLCCDGFRHKITDEEMRMNLFPTGNMAPDGIKSYEEALITAIKQRGETDNISVITAYVE